MTAPRQTSRFPSPWIRMSWDRRDRHRLLTVTALLGVVLAATLAAFGLPPLDLHGPLHRLGIMGPFCGSTRAAYFTTQGQWALAWKYNPLGILAVLAAVAVTARAIVGLLTRGWLTVQLQWTPRRRRMLITLVLVTLVVLEVRQQFRADLLMAGT